MANSVKNTYKNLFIYLLFPYLQKKRVKCPLIFLNGARELPTLELVHETIINLKKVLNQDFVTDLKYFDVA